MEPAMAFVWGCTGSVLVEVVNIINGYNKPPHKLPPKYHNRGYLIVRCLLALGAGFLALAYEVNTEILALNIGIAAPLIIERLLQSFDGSVPA